MMEKIRGLDHFNALFELCRMSYYLCDSDQRTKIYEFMKYVFGMKYCYFSVFITTHVCIPFDRAFGALSNGIYHCQLR